MMAWLDRIGWTWPLLAAAWMAVAPITPEPHLTEKLRMLSQGTLSRPIDIFDMCFHAAPSLLVALKAWRQFGRRSPPP